MCVPPVMFLNSASIFPLFIVIVCVWFSIFMVIVPVALGVMLIFTFNVSP